MNRIVLLLLAAAVVSGCNSKQSDNNTQSSEASPGVSSDTATAQHPPEQVVAAPDSPRASHNYAINQNGTYGYEPALSDDDVRAGKATTALVMMRYIGLKDGSYTLLLVDEDDPSISNRITCQAPCNFAKSQIMDGKSVVQTETLRVVPESLIGAMIEDAMSGHLTPYGQRKPL